MWLIKIIYWLQAFLCPVILFGLVGIFTNEHVLVILLGIGAITGIAFAEYVRRTIGLDKFFGSVSGQSDSLKEDDSK